MQKKTAQELKLRHKARRLVNPTGAAHATLNPTFRKVVKDLDKTDKKVRKEAEDLSYYIGMARSFARRKDYLSAATYLAKFHEKVRGIHHNLASFDDGVSRDNRKFLLRQFKSKDKNQLFNYDPEKKLDEVEKTKEDKYADDGLVSTAGVIKDVQDWWKTPGRFSDLAHNLTSTKSKSMRALENHFSDEFVSRLKEQTIEMLKESNQLYKGLLESFHRMGYAWGARDVGRYLKEITEVKSAYEPYHKQYVEYYKLNIVPLKELQAKQDAEEKKEREEKKQQEAKENPKFEQEKDPFSRQVPDSDPATLKGMGPMSVAPPSERVGPPTKHYIDNPNTQETDMAYIDTSRDDGPITQRSPGIPPRPQSVRQMPSERVGPPTKVPSQRIGPPTKQPMRDGPANTNRGFGLPPVQYAPKVNTLRQPFVNEGAPFSFNPPKGWVPPSLSDVAEYDLTKRKAHEDFLGRIEKLSTNDEIVREILSYSEEVEKYSADESLKLLSVAEGMIEKDAGLFDMVKKKLLGPDSEPEEAPKTIVQAPEEAPVPSDGQDLTNLAPKNKLEPVNHGIPAGKVEMRWKDIPFLAAKSVDDIILSPRAANVILEKLVKFLYHKHVPYTNIQDYQNKIIEAVKRSMVKGQIVSNMACNDKHNGRDCSLEVFSYIRLGEIDPAPVFRGLTLSYTATCRLSSFEGDITIGNINGPKLHAK